MTDKEKYTALLQKYWEAETSPEEEMELAQYSAQTNDPDFDEIRGVLGFLSIGREKAIRHSHTVRLFTLAAIASCAVAVVAIGVSHKGPESHPELCIRYSYGEKYVDNEPIMSSVQSTLATFFANGKQMEDDSANVPAQ